LFIALRSPAERDILCAEMNVEPNSSLPIHIARAYGLQQAKPTVPVEQAREAVEAQRTEIRKELTNSQRNIARLIAGVVPGGIDFDAPEPIPSDRTSIPFYSHPAAQNAASTSISSTGRSIDVTG
jgi:hypothetical protein